MKHAALLSAAALALTAAPAHAIPGQCAIDPVTGLSGSIFNSMKAAMLANSTLAASAGTSLGSGSNYRLFLCIEVITPIAEQIYAATTGGTVTEVDTGTGLTGGPITSTGSIGLANTAVTPGSYTTANITVDATGRLTAAANGSGGTVTSITAGTGLSGGTITGSGTIALSTPVAIANGGTNATAIGSAGSIAYSSAGTSVGWSSAGTSGQIAHSGGTGTPTFSAVDLASATQVSGLLANANLANPSTTVTAGTGMSGGGTCTLGASCTLTNAGVTSNVAGTGIGVSGATGAVAISNTGVTSAVAGTGIGVSAATGAVTFSANYGTSSSTACAGNDGRLPPAPSAAGNLIRDTGSAYATLAAGSAHQTLHGGTTETWSADDLTADVTGTLPAANGGTGNATYAVGDLLYASGSTALSRLADVGAGAYLRSGGTTTAPLWSTLILPNAATTGDVFAATGTNTAGVIAAVTAGRLFISQGASTLPAWTALSGDATITSAGVLSITKWGGRIIYGDGSAGSSTVSSNSSLAANGLNTSVTINATKTLSVAGFIMQGSNTFTLNGTLSAAGNNAVANAGGADVSGANYLNNAVNGGGGGNSNNGNGTAGTAVTVGCGGAGGAGGSGGGRTGGAAGAENTNGPGVSSCNQFPFALMGENSAAAFPAGGSGGGGGGGTGAATGGGGGGGGGVVIVAFPHIVLGAAAASTAVITVAGGTGATATTNNSSGGGGGGGGYIVIIYDDLKDASGNVLAIPTPSAGVYTFSNGAIVTAAAGARGTGLGTGGAGTAGTAGNVYFLPNVNSN